MRITIYLSGLLVISAAFNSCKPDLTVPTPSAGSADFSKSIAVGDDFMAGYGDGALYNKGQQLSVPALLAKQFPSSTTFVQPLISDDDGLGYNVNPYSHNYVTRSKLGYRTDCLGASSLYPINSELTSVSAQGYLMSVSYSVNNFSVPQLKTKDYFNASAGSGSASGNVFYHRFASAPGTSTVYSDAVATNATFFTAWVGMADIFNYAMNGGVKKGITPAVKDTLPSSTEFSLYLDSLLHRLTANGAKGAIATIPSLESFPFFTLIPYNGLTLRQGQADSLNMFTPFGFHGGSNGFVIDCSTCTFPYRLIGNGEHVLLSVPLDSVKCTYMGTLSSIPDAYILDSTEMDAIHQAIDAYNSIIVQRANQYNLALVDMNQYFKTVVSGIKWNGADINADFISGGFFSTDGYHPNQIGYSLIANEFISAINQKYRASVSPVNCTDCDGIRFP